MSNVQYPIANFEIGYSTLDILHFPRRGPDTGYEDRDELITLVACRLNPFRAETHPLGELQPRLSLTKFLQAYLQLVDEVLARFGTLCLAVIRERRCSASRKL